jgi:tRNA(fMet)-specific endonuclease VapC
MNKAILDTDIFSEMMDAKNPRVVAQAAAYRASYGSITISTVTVFEVVKGLHHLKREQRIQQFLAQIPFLTVLPLNTASAELAGRIFADLDRVGQRIGLSDSLIAAIAITHSLELVTGNTRHYHRVVNVGYPLRLDNWRV